MCKDGKIRGVEVEAAGLSRERGRVAGESEPDEGSGVASQAHVKILSIRLRIIPPSTRTNVHTTREWGHSRGKSHRRPFLPISNRGRRFIHSSSVLANDT